MQTKKKQKQKPINFGAFIVEPMYAIDTLVAYNIRSKSKNFMLRVGMGTNAFDLINRLYDDIDMRDYVETIINMMYQMTMIVPDGEFMSGYVCLVNDLIKRFNTYRNDVSEKRSLQDMKVVAAVQDIDSICGTNLFDDAMDAVREKENELKS